MDSRPNINTASVRELTQLPGIAKNIAYRIVNHRQRHGWFTSWRELLEVKEFPVERLDEIKARATLVCPEDRENCLPPRHMGGRHVEEVKKKPAGYTRAIRSTRRSDKVKERAGPRH